MPGTDKVLTLQCHALYITKENFDQRLVTVALEIARTLSEPDETNDKIQLWTFFKYRHI